MAERITAHINFSAYQVPDPPADLVDRVVDAAARHRRRRLTALVAAVALTAAAALGLVLVHPGVGLLSTTGAMTATAHERVSIGNRADVWLEGGASINWRVPRVGPAQVDHARGAAHYHVVPGRAFEVTTPAGTIRVLGTSFRVEVTPMTKRALVGAAAAATVVVVVYQGRVVFENDHGKIELEAGQSASATKAASPSRNAASLTDDSGSTARGMDVTPDSAATESGEQARRPIPRLPEPTRGRLELAPSTDVKPIPSEATRAAMETVRPRIDECYERVADEWPGLAKKQHRLAVRFHVDTDLDHSAVVTHASVEGHPLADDPAFSECVTETIYTIGRYLPAPMVEGGVGIVYPLALD